VLIAGAGNKSEHVPSFLTVSTGDSHNVTIVRLSWFIVFSSLAKLYFTYLNTIKEYVLLTFAENVLSIVLLLISI